MKSMVKFLGIIAIAAVIGFAFAACDTGTSPANGGGDQNQPVNVAVTGITLTRTELHILMGRTGQLYAIVAPADASNTSVTWSSSNTNIATVEGGLVTAVSAGTATITATTVNGGFSARADVTVSPYAVAVTGVTVAPASINLDVGETVTLTETIEPSGATNQSVLWSSSDTDIAIVLSCGTVTAIKPGSAIITITTDDGDFTATSNVTVNPIWVRSVSVKESTFLAIGGRETLYARIEPYNACNQSVTWRSDYPAIAEVSASGEVTARSVGTATITVTTNCGGRTATTTVTVRAYETPVRPWISKFY